MPIVALRFQHLLHFSRDVCGVAIIKAICQYLKLLYGDPISFSFLQCTNTAILHQEVQQNAHSMAAKQEEVRFLDVGPRRTRTVHSLVVRREDHTLGMSNVGKPSGDVVVAD